MGVKSDKVLNVDARNFPAYDSANLDYFQGILNDILGEYRTLNSLSPDEREHLKARVAAAIFKGAEAGERDYTLLKRGAIEAVSAIPSSSRDA